MTLTLWEANQSLFPTDREESNKLISSMLETVRKSIDSGDLMLWGESAGGACGFAVSERDIKEIYAMTAMYSPYIKFEVKPMLSVEEVIEIHKGMKK